MELASSRENWYALKTKALMELGLRDECYLYSKKALSDLTNFHYNNDSRFARRIALSKAKL